MIKPSTYTKKKSPPDLNVAHTEQPSQRPAHSHFFSHPFLLLAHHCLQIFFPATNTKEVCYFRIENTESEHRNGIFIFLLEYDIMTNTRTHESIVESACNNNSDNNSVHVYSSLNLLQSLFIEI